MGDACTVFCANLSPKVTEELLYELFLQAGPLNLVKIPKDMKGEQRSYAFVEFKHECSVDYAIQLFQDTFLHGKELQLNRRRNRNQDSSADGNNHMKRQASLPNMHQAAPGMPPRHQHLNYMHIPPHFMLHQGPMMPPFHQMMHPPFHGMNKAVQDPRGAAFLDQATRFHGHNDRRSGNDYQPEVANGRYLGQSEEESRRDRSEREHRRSHSEHHRRRSRSRSRERSYRQNDRQRHNTDDDHRRRQSDSRSRYWDR